VLYLQTYGSLRGASLPCHEETPFLFLCRSIYQLPGLQATLTTSLDDTLAAMAREKEALSAMTEVEVAVERGAIGNEVVAHSIISSGARIVDLHSPFSVGVYEEVKTDCCIHCGMGTHGAAVHTCTSCCIAAYCSPECWEAHREQHTIECRPLQKLSAVMENVDARMLDVPQRFYEVAFHCTTTIAAIRMKTPGYDLVRHLESHTAEVAQHMHPSVDIIHEIWEGAVDHQHIADVMGVIMCNAIEVVDDTTGRGISQGLHCTTIASFFNHSCLPNCCINTSLGCIVTTRTIQPGEALTLSYIPQLYWPTLLRQELLRENFFFTCRCPRCQPRTDGRASPVDPFEGCLTMKLPQSVQADPTAYYHSIVQVACTRVRSSDVADLSLELMRDTEKLLAEVLQHVYPFHYLCHELRNSLTFLYTALRRHEDCFLSCMEELLLWETIIPGALPIKQLKLINAIQCLEEMREEEAKVVVGRSVLGPYVHQLASLYDICNDG